MYLVELATEDAPHVAANYDHVVVVKVLPGRLALVEESREGVRRLQDERVPYQQLRSHEHCCFSNYWIYKIKYLDLLSPK
jgi:hypothetical protein